MERTAECRAVSRESQAGPAPWKIWEGTVEGLENPGTGENIQGLLKRISMVTLIESLYCAE